MLLPQSVAIGRLRNVKMNRTSLAISAILFMVGLSGYTNAGPSACPAIIERSEWGALQAKKIPSKLKVSSAQLVIIHHTKTESCYKQALCHTKVRKIQDEHINNNSWSDIGPNFLVGEDGNVYEGRGWNNRGAHAVGFNSQSVGISFIGNFKNRQPEKAALNAAKKLIKCGVDSGKINKTYVLLEHKQVAQTACPGNKLFNVIRKWPGWQSNPPR